MDYREGHALSHMAEMRFMGGPSRLNLHMEREISLSLLTMYKNQDAKIVVLDLSTLCHK